MILHHDREVGAAMVVLAVHPTVREIAWVPGITIEAALEPGQQFSREAVWVRRLTDCRVSTGVDTIGWVSGQNPYFTARVLQVSDTAGNPLPVTAVTVTRGSVVRF